MASPEQIADPGVYVTNRGLEVTDGIQTRVQIGDISAASDGSAYGAVVRTSQGLPVFDAGQPTGLGTATMDLIRSSLQNNTFGVGIAGALPLGATRSDPVGHTTALPSWTASADAGAGTLTYTADATFPSGACVVAAFAAGSKWLQLNADRAVVSVGQGVDLRATFSATVPGGVTLEVQLVWDYVAADGTTVIGSGGRDSFYTADVTLAQNIVEFVPPSSVPLNTRYVQPRIATKETVSHSASTRVNFGGVFVGPSVPVVGRLTWALPVGASMAAAANAQTVTLPISGGSVAVPIHLPSPMSLGNLSVYCNDVANAHTAEWRLYLDPLAGSNTLSEVVGANGTFSFTPGAAGRQLSNAAAAVLLSPGIYWLVLRNTSGAVTFGLGRSAGTNGWDLTEFQTKTLASSLGSTLDFVTDWSKSSGGGCFLSTVLQGYVLGGGVVW